MSGQVLDGSLVYDIVPEVKFRNELGIDEGILFKLGHLVRLYREKYVLQLSGAKNPVYEHINPYLVPDSDSEICTLATNSFDLGFVKIEDIFYRYCGKVALGGKLDDYDLNLLREKYWELENLESQRIWD
jgi:hypothetical protein